MSRRAERRRWRDTGEPAWRRYFARRMREGREHCRGCEVVMRHVNLQRRGLRFGHIRAACLGGGDGPGNITIVCGACDQYMGSDDWTGVLHGLRAEPQWRHHQRDMLRRFIDEDRAPRRTHVAPNEDVDPGDRPNPTRAPATTCEGRREPGLRRRRLITAS